MAGTQTIASASHEVAPVGNCAVRLSRCRDVTNMLPVLAVPPVDKESLLAHYNGLDKEAKFRVARDHILHRMRAMEHQLSAYAQWKEILDTPIHERTPGEEHFDMCMTAWEKQYKTVIPTSDYESDAALMLFDMNMTYHDQAAQALLHMEEVRRLREAKLFKNLMATTYTGSQKMPLVKRPLDDLDSPDWGHNEDASALATANKKQCVDPTSPKTNAERIEGNAEL